VVEVVEVLIVMELMVVAVVEVDLEERVVQELLDHLDKDTMVHQTGKALVVVVLVLVAIILMVELVF
jgi:hypothetical protein